jgi:hypothetical protein
MVNACISDVKSQIGFLLFEQNKSTKPVYPSQGNWQFQQKNLDWIEPQMKLRPVI